MRATQQDTLFLMWLKFKRPPLGAAFVVVSLSYSLLSLATFDYDEGYREENRSYANGVGGNRG